jgi:iron complex outermembrane receptor protein
VLGGIAVLGCNVAGAQDAAIDLPDVNVTSSRLGTTKPRQPARESAPQESRAPTRVSAPRAAPPKPSGTPVAAPAAAPAGGTGDVKVELPSGITTGTTITGASTTVITSEQIARSPSATVQDILASEPGIQVRSLFGGVNGSQSTVDMRGFGATASSNTLVLINGRRINDIDLAGVDLSTIPRESIDHIEITRGNSGGVLYGDGAVGGVINIVTKTGADLPPSARIAGTFGSFNYAEGAVSANNTWNGPWGKVAASVYGNDISSDGYRHNNQLKQQNGVADFRFIGDQGNGYLTLSADNQHLGLPGGRLVDPSLGINLVATDRQGAATPFDYGDKQGINATAGISRMVAPGTEFVIDGGVRQKKQQAGFFPVDSFCLSVGGLCDSYIDATLTTFSLTPRMTSNHNLAGTPGKLIAGMDIYESIYGSDRANHIGDAPIHHYDLNQLTGALYGMETLTLWNNTDFGFGGRVQRNSLSARDRFDPNAPGAAFSAAPVEGQPLDSEETQYAWHLGLEHRFNQYFALFGRMARSFRLPTVDERVGMSPFGVPTNFDLRTQTSRDYEAGIRVRYGAVELQTSAYLMNLQNEIFFSPATFINTNLDPTRRYGVENIATWQATQDVRFRFGLAYTRAVFVEGPFAGNDVPLVARWTESVGVQWNIYQKYLVLDAVARFVGPRRMDNDSLNVQPLIPSNTVVDLRLGGEYQNFFWSIAVQNLFNVQYFEYAVASTFTLGRYSAYPLPGRVVMLKGGMKF